MAVQALDLKNGVFGMSLLHEPCGDGDGNGGAGCASKSVHARPHQWRSLSDGAMQLFFQRDLWLDEVVALMLANCGDPTPAMRTVTTPPLQLEASCDLRRRRSRPPRAPAPLPRAWLVRLGASGVCQVAITAPP